jgi:hypothetical protein
VESKTCSVCHIEKTLDMFTKLKVGKNGRAARCKACTNVYRAERNRIDPSKPKEYYTKGNARIKAEVLTHYGHGKCACVRCGFGDIRALSIDHIEGHNSKSPRSSKSGIGFYRRLKRLGFPEGLQTLCMNCQFIKRTERKEYNKCRVDG